MGDVGDLYWDLRWYQATLTFWVMTACGGAAAVVGVITAARARRQRAQRMAAVLRGEDS